MEFSKEIIQLTERAEKALGPVFAGFAGVPEVEHLEQSQVIKAIHAGTACRSRIFRPPPSLRNVTSC